MSAANVSLIYINHLVCMHLNPDVWPYLITNYINQFFHDAMWRERNLRKVGAYADIYKKFNWTAQLPLVQNFCHDQHFYRSPLHLHQECQASTLEHPTTVLTVLILVHHAVSMKISHSALNSVWFKYLAK